MTTITEAYRGAKKETSREMNRESGEMLVGSAGCLSRATYHQGLFPALSSQRTMHNMLCGEVPYPHAVAKSVDHSLPWLRHVDWRPTSQIKSPLQTMHSHTRDNDLPLVMHSIFLVHDWMVASLNGNSQITGEEHHYRPIWQICHIGSG